MRIKLLVLTMAVAATAIAQPRCEITLSDNWQFCKGSCDNDGAVWKTVSVPHDWAISGPFDKKWDLQTVAIEQNGEKQATEKSGRSGALPWIGEGHYRRTFQIPEGYEHAELVFDGAMAEPSVSINGHKAGYWAYGYNAFRIDITPYIKTGDNLLEVDLKNVEESSRWYPGAGIYRPVKLVLTPKSHIDMWQTCVQTLSIQENKALIRVSAKVENPLEEQEIFISLIDRDGQIVKTNWVKVPPHGDLTSTIEVEEPS